MKGVKKDDFSFSFLVVSSKMLLQRPIAGSQVPFCPLEKKVPDSWSRIEPGTFKVRGPTYLRLENCVLFFFHEYACLRSILLKI